MKSTFMAAAAAFALVVPTAGAIAQNTPVESKGGVYTMNDMQQGMYDGWPADRQSSYDEWPNTYQEYYWTLTPAQQGGWWVLNNDQRARLYAMAPEQRQAAWTAIAAQMNQQSTMPNSSTSASSSSTTSMSSGGQMQFVRKEMAQPITQSSASSVNADDLPVCSPNQQDGCINSWEKNKTGTKPLDHWPGKPASEM